MDGQKTAQGSAHSQDNNFKRPVELEALIDASDLGNGHSDESEWDGAVTVPGRMTDREAQRTEWNYFRSLFLRDALAHESRITIAEFVEHKFVPERVSRMRYSGQLYYRAMLKHVLKPEEVNRVFKVDTGNSKARVEAIPEWPYLGGVPLRDVQPDHIQRLISAALQRGYSSQTVTHIRNVIVAVFSYAKKEHLFAGDNPASHLTLSKATSKKVCALKLAQAREVIHSMNYPEKEMTLFTILPGLSPAEICGLQWKDVNLTDWDFRKENEPIPPRAIAIRRRWSRVGTPISQTNLVARRLKHIATQLNVPSPSWQVFRRTHKALSSEFGVRFQEILIGTSTPPLPDSSSIHEIWHCRTQKRRGYSEWD